MNEASSIKHHHSNRLPGWLPINESDSVFNWVHFPEQNMASIAIIIVGPVGPEYMYCHRSLKCFTAELAESGFITVRYDPIGMGNSSGNLRDPGLLDSWLASLKKVHNDLLDIEGVDSVAFVGLRSGALILSEYLKEESADAVAFWYPYVNGRAFSRDLKMIDRVLHSESEDPSFINGGGYPFSQESLTALDAINLSKSPILKVKRVLSIEDSNLPPNSRLENHLRTFSELKTIRCDGLQKMIKPASESVVPYDNLQMIKSWFEDTYQVKETVPNISWQSTDYSTSDFSETTIDLSEGNSSKIGLFGVLTKPVGNYESVVLLVNAGSGHHVGPNRLNVEMARYLAKHNIASIRFDISQLGESAADIHDLSNHPYNQEAVSDIASALPAIKNRFAKKIHLVGLCSGAYNFFHAALMSKGGDIESLVICNPLTFYWKEGDSIYSPQSAKLASGSSNYKEQSKDLNKWIKLAKDPVRLFRVIKRVAFGVIAKFLSPIRLGLMKKGLYPLQKLDRDLIELASRGISLACLYSEGEPGFQILKAEAPVFLAKNRNKDSLKVRLIKHADHTFSTVRARDKLSKEILNCISK